MKTLKLLDPIRRGLITVVTLFFALKLLKWALLILLSLIEPLQSLILYWVGEENYWLSLFLSIVVLIPICWLVGQVSISKTIFYIFRKRAKTASGKYLFSVRIKNNNFYGGYPIGLAVKEIRNGDRLSYNILFPHLGGFIVLPSVPKEDLEVVDQSVATTILFYLSCGSL